MDNVKNLTDKIKKFYALVETHDAQIKDWIKDTIKPLYSIVNQSSIYRAVVPVNSVQNTPFERFEGFRESLIDTILKSLEDELEILGNISNKINSANQILQKDQTIIENFYLKTRNSITRSNLNPSSPSLEHIIDWSSDVWRYYHSFYLQISQAIVTINFEDEKSVNTLTQAFKEDLELKKDINKIRSFNFSEFDFVV